MTSSRLAWVPFRSRPDLVAAPVAAALAAAGDAAVDVEVAEIDPDLADTAAFCERYGVALDDSANCVVVHGRRDGVERVAACHVLATTRADVNTVVRRRLDVRKATFMPLETAVAETGMEYGGIVALGLPDGWRVLVDALVVDRRVVVGSGLRRSKLRLAGQTLVRLAAAEVVPDLARPVAPAG